MLKINSVKTQLSVFIKSDTMPEKVFAFVALFIGVFLIFLIPPFFGYDESHHYYRAYQQAQGDILPYSEIQNGYTRYGGNIPENIIRLGELTHTQLAQNQKNKVGNMEFIFTKDITVILNSAPSSNKNFVAFDGSAVYSPVAYIPSIIGIFLSDLLNLTVKDSLNLTRMMNLVFFVIITYFAIKIAPKSVKFLIAAIALIPMAIHQSSTISADGMALSLSLFVISGSLALAMNYKRNILTITIAAATLLALVKPTYAFISMLTVVAVAYSYTKSTRFNNSEKRKTYLSKKSILQLLLLVTVISIPTLVWYFLSAEASDNIKNLLLGSPAFQQIDADKQKILVITQPHIFIIVFMKTLLIQSQEIFQGLFGRVSWVGVALPFYSILANFLLLFLLAPRKKEIVKLQKSNIFWLLVLLIAVVTTIAIYLALYITFNPVGSELINWVQGRYFLPILPLYILAIVNFLGLDVKAKYSRQKIYFVGAPLILIHSALYYVIT